MSPGILAQPPPLSLKPQSTEGPPEPELHENEWYRQSFEGYKVKEQLLHTKRPLRVIIVGAGAAGLQIAYKAERQLENVSWVIYEKNTDVGGTWLENRYPGCTCDIPSHSYQFSFYRNPNWSSYYSRSEEIWKYFKDFAVENDLEKYVRFKHKVEEARWIEEDGVWEVTIQRPDGTTFTDRGEILASASGVLNTWKYPDLPGIDKFRGKLMHSAHWDASYDLTGKTVAVIGGGSSAVQIIPSIQPLVKKLVTYSRSPVWITAGFGAKYAAPGGLNFEYSEEQKRQFKEDPAAFEKYCLEVEGELNRRFTLMHLKSVDQTVSREFVAKTMRERLGNDPRLTEKLIPKYGLGCRRMTPGSDYLQSLLRSNVEVISESAVEFAEDGVIDASGKKSVVDVVVCATGFDTTFALPYTVIGKDGRDLRKEWGDFPKGYLSVMAEGFPNLFFFMGPNGPGSHGSFLPIVEWHTRYMFMVLTHMQRTVIKSINPKIAAVKDAYIHTHELLKRTAWSSACNSWFKNGKKHGPVIAIWPGSRLHYFEVLKEVRYEDLDIEYWGNRYGYWGNGYTKAETEEGLDVVWYIDTLQQELAIGPKAFDMLLS